MQVGDQPPPEPKLLELARKKFATLTHAEEELFRATQEGREASVLTGNEKEDNPANAANWDADRRVVRAESIVWLYTDSQASAFLTHRGVTLVGMGIDADLDLSYAEIKFSLKALNCVFSGNILLLDAQLRGIYLLGCLIKSLNAHRAKIRGGVMLRNGFKAEGEVRLVGATIDGDLDCNGAQFSNPNGIALFVDAAKIDGSIFLPGGFKAAGQVGVMGATIAGDLDCDGGQFSNPNGVALAADRAKIGRGIFLRNGFKAEGVVRLVGATIGGSLECDGGQFSNPNGIALNANGAKIERNVFLRNGFKAEGMVQLGGATIDGALNCNGGQFSNPNGIALAVERTKIGSDFFLFDGFKAEGEVRLLGATIGGDLDCDGAQFSNPNGIALFADTAKIGRNVFLRNGFKAEGIVSLVSADLGRLFVYGGLIEPENAILDLRLAKTGTLWDDKESWPSAGNLFVDGFNYELLSDDSPHDAKSRTDWLHRQPRRSFLPQPYEQLAIVSRQMGHERDARLVMIEKNRDRARFTHFPRQGWWWYNLFGRLIGYGYAPWKAFAISVTMILLGWFVFYLGFSHGLVSPTREDAYVRAPNGHLVLGKSGRPEISKDYPVFNPLVYSLESFIPLIKFDQSASWAPNANSGTEISRFHLQAPSGRLLRYYLYFHIAAGWLFTSLWVGAVTGLVKS